MFDWWKRRRVNASRSRRPSRRALPRRLPKRQLAPIEEIVEQGLLVADVAIRMSVKNEIILNALGRKADYDETQIKRMVLDSVCELAVERERDARRIAQMRGEIRQTGRSSWSENDYGSEDSATLRHRQEVYEQVAARLRQRADDDHYLNDLAKRSHAAAWREIGDSLKDRASHPYYAGGSSSEYQRERQSRIDLFVQHDLNELVRSRDHVRRDTPEKRELKKRHLCAQRDTK